jgi:hypothetical protein
MHILFPTLNNTGSWWKEMCRERGISILSLVPYSLSSNGIVEQLAVFATSGPRAMLRNSGLPARLGDGRVPYELFYNMTLGVSDIHTFGWIVCLALPAKPLGNLDERAARGWQQAEARVCPPHRVSSCYFDVLAGPL